MAWAGGSEYLGNTLCIQLIYKLNRMYRSQLRSRPHGYTEGQHNDLITRLHFRSLWEEIQTYPRWGVSLPDGALPPVMELEETQEKTHLPLTIRIQTDKQWRVSLRHTDKCESCTQQRKWTLNDTQNKWGVYRPGCCPKLAARYLWVLNKYLCRCWMLSFLHLPLCFPWINFPYHALKARFQCTEVSHLPDPALVLNGTLQPCQKTMPLISAISHARSKEKFPYMPSSPVAMAECHSQRLWKNPSPVSDGESDLNFSHEISRCLFT